MSNIEFDDDWGSSNEVDVWLQQYHKDPQHEGWVVTLWEDQGFTTAGDFRDFIRDVNQWRLWKDQTETPKDWSKRLGFLRTISQKLKQEGTVLKQEGTVRLP
jgi:hypothetical protein